MLKGEYFKKYVKNVELAEDGNEVINDYREKVKVLYNGYLERVKIADAPMIYGFNPEYSVEKKFPEIIEYWNKKNTEKPKDIFFKADRFIILDIEDNEKVINLLDTNLDDIEDIRELNKTRYNFKTYKKFIELVEESKTSTFTSELASRYLEVVSYFLEKDREEIKEIEDDIYLVFNRTQLRKFLRSGKINSFSKSGYLVSTYNFTFELLDLDLRIGVDDLDVTGDSMKYIKKEELLHYCSQCDNVQTAYILYGTFLGLGEDQFEILRTLKMSDIDKKNLVINKNGIKIDIDNEFIEIAEECDLLSDYDETSLTTLTVKRVYLNSNSEYILKPRRRANNSDGLEPMASISIRNIISKASMLFFNDRHMNKTFLHRSGILHNMYRLEKESGIEWNTYILSEKDNGLTFTFNIRDMLNAYKNNYK